ncbi:MAG: hypothetical protein JW928_01080 [Candidatus Aureabacteria bacterium]|nr:hypothetical protein [Candidatus Auribacterota bacterium]
MKKDFFVFALIVCSVFVFQGCHSDRTQTMMVVHKSFSLPDKKSFYSLWMEEDKEVKEKVIFHIDEVADRDGSFSNPVKEEWKGLSLTVKDEYLEDFFLRRKKSLFCRHGGTKPYRTYLRTHLSKDFLNEFSSLMTLSPDVRKKIEEEKDAFFIQNAIGAVKKKENVRSLHVKPKDDATYYYDEAVKKSGLDSSDEGKFIEDVTDKVKK